MQKVLLISSYAPPAIGGPKIIYNLFRDLPPASYAVLTSFWNIDNRSAKTGDWLPGAYYFYDKPGASREDFKTATDAKPAVRSRSFFSWLKHLVKRSRIVGTLLGPFIIFGQIFWIVREGRKTIAKERPTMLLAVSDYGPALIGSYFLHRLTKVPLALYLFDLYKGNFFPFPGGLLAAIFEKRIFRAATTMVVTNEGTREYYAKRYDAAIAAKLRVIYNGVFPEPYLHLIAPYDPKPPYRIVYTGRIAWPQEGNIRLLFRAVESIHDIPFSLDMYCPNPPEYLRSLGLTSKKAVWSVAPPDQMPAIQSQADILYLPLSWHTRSQDIVDTATPGKLSDYLISGRPILVHAPASSFLAKYAREYGFAEVVDTEDVKTLRAAIRKLLADPAYGRSLVANARAVFEQHHDANKDAALFRALFFGA